MKNPKYYNNDVVNTMINNEDLCPEHTGVWRVPSKANEEVVMASILEYVMTQYNLKQGFQIYSERREEAKPQAEADS